MAAPIWASGGRPYCPSPELALYTHIESVKVTDRFLLNIIQLNKYAFVQIFFSFLLQGARGAFVKMPAYCGYSINQYNTGLVLLFPTSLTISKTVLRLASGKMFGEEIVHSMNSFQIYIMWFIISMILWNK